MIDLRPFSLRFDVDYLLYFTSGAYRVAVPFSVPKLHDIRMSMISSYKGAIKEKKRSTTWKSDSPATYVFLNPILTRLKSLIDRPEKEEIKPMYCRQMNKTYCQEQMQVLLGNFWEVCTDAGKPPRYYDSVNMLFVYDSVLMHVGWGSDGHNSSGRPSGLFTFCKDPLGRGVSEIDDKANEVCNHLTNIATMIDVLYTKPDTTRMLPTSQAEMEAAVAKLSDVRVAGFWHIGRMGMWREIVMEQMETLVDSGLDDRSHVIHTVLVGQGEELPVEHPKLDVRYGPRLDAYEYPTLALAQNYCSERPGDIIWYIHSKGSSKNEYGVPNVVAARIW